MREFDFEISRQRANQIFGRQWWQRAIQLMLPVTTHVGSLVTISVAWFARSGSFKFNLNAAQDWGVGLIAAVVAFGGIYLIRKALPSPSEITVSRDDLSALLAVTRSNATISIHIVAGDLSWLADDLESILAIKARKPALRIYIHYDRHRVSKDEVHRIDELGLRGIILRPYKNRSIIARFTLIDIEDTTSRRSFTYEHARAPTVTETRSNNPFVWREFGPDSVVVMRAFCTAIELLMDARTDPLKIGILGANNVGKTSLANALRDTLNKRFRVQLIPDQFRLVNDGASFSGSIAILLLEIIGTPIQGDVDIVIYDRTLLDNLLFLRLRTDGDDIYNEIVKQIVSAMRTFDLLVYITGTPEVLSNRTTHVLAKDRRRVQEMFDECLSTYDIPHNKITLPKDSFEQSLQIQSNLSSVKNGIFRPI